jgi:hypothetical protein
MEHELSRMNFRIEQSGHFSYFGYTEKGIFSLLHNTGISKEQYLVLSVAIAGLRVLFVITLAVFE